MEDQIDLRNVDQSEPLISARDQDGWPLLRRRLARWMIWPMIFAAGCWVLLLFPSGVAPILPCKTPDLSPASPPSVAPAPAPSGPPKKKNLSPEEKQLVPKDMLSAWLVGRIAGLLEATGASGANETEATYLEQVASILNIPVASLSIDKVLKIGEFIEVAQHTWSRDALAWMLGALTLVNILWTVGICGMACSIGPILYCCFQPVLELIYYYMLIPLYILLLRLKEMYEPLAYCACLYIIALAQCFSPGPRDWIVVTGLALSLSAFSHWSHAHVWDHEGEDRYVNRERWEYLEFASASLASAYLMMASWPMAVKFESGFLGFIASGTFYGSVGFYVIPWLLGRFNSSRSVEQEDLSSVLGPQWLASLLVCVPYIIVKMGSGVWLEPPLAAFQVGLATFGPMGLFLWGLIISSRGKSASGGEYVNRHYIATNFGYIILVATATLAGYSFHVETILRLGLTFGVLWGALKVFDAIEAFVKEPFGYVVTLYVSLMLWLLALFFHSHPSWLPSLFG